MTKDTEATLDILLDTSEELNPFIRDNCHNYAKDGLSIALFALLDSIDIKSCNRIINQVSNTRKGISFLLAA